MADENLGVGKRMVKRTERVQDFDNKMAASRARREQYARSKKVAAQEAELLASEQPSEEDGEDDTGTNLRRRKSVITMEMIDDATHSPRTKGQASSKAGEEDPERTRLLDLISVLMATPREQLALFETSALQALWDQRVGNKSANSAAGSKAGAKQKAKSQPMATPKAKHLKASVPMKSQITMIGSPVVALKQVEQETARVMDSPIAERRKRDAPVDRIDSGPKRIHLDTQGQSSQAAPHAGETSRRVGQSKPAVTISQPGSTASSTATVAPTRPSGPASQSRASSRAPSGPPSRASSTAPTAPRAKLQLPPASRSVSHTPALVTSAQLAALVPQDTESSDIEVPGLGDGTSDEYRDEDILADDEDEQVPVVSTGNNAGTGGRANAKGPGGKKKNAQQPESLRVLNVKLSTAVECTLCIKSQEGFFPDAQDGALMLSRGWEMSVHDCAEEICRWEMKQDHITVICARVGSFRARGRSRINDAFRGIYNLNITEENSINQVKERAKGLYPIEFHRNPKVASKRAGHYRHPFLAEAVYLVFYTGDKPLATRFSNELSKPTIPMIAVTCTMIEDLLIRYARDGCYLKDTKGQSGNRSVPKDLQVICARHEKNLVTFRDAVPAVFERWIEKFAEQVRACGGKKPLPNRRQSQIEPGVLDISAFADEANDSDDAPQPQVHPSAVSPVPRPRPRPRPCPVEQAGSRSSPSEDSNPTPAPSQPAQPYSSDGQNDEEMADAECQMVAVKDGHGDEEMAEGEPTNTAQGDDQASSSGTQKDVGPPNVPAPNVDEDDEPLTDLEDSNVVPAAHEKPVSPVPHLGAMAADEPGPSTGSMEKGIDKLKAKQPPATQRQEKQAKQGGKGRQPNGAGAASITKGKRKGAAKNAGDVDPVAVNKASKMATRATAKLSKLARK
ncbi:hypothetical protein RhiLY_00549 [Ceratobasidium sp. AG-Ba]|nr:hypothetical protein RhiLY_00549 [Ceratobasidium sp. AG-Ba]